VRSKVKISVGSMANQCPACGQRFHSISAFDSHRSGEYAAVHRRCLTSAEMTELGMVVNESGNWGNVFESGNLKL
jgi:hypothetical protein